MSNVTDELKNILASLNNIVTVLESEDQAKTVAPEVPAPAVDTPETPAETTTPVVDGQVADNTPSSNPAVETVSEVPTPEA